MARCGPFAHPERELLRSLRSFGAAGAPAALAIMNAMAEEYAGTA